MSALTLTRPRTVQAGPIRRSRIALAHTPKCAGQARVWALDTVTGWGVRLSDRDSFENVTSELVTNAFEYTAGPLSARLTSCPEFLCLAVHDPDPGPLHLPTGSLADVPWDEQHGRGLLYAIECTNWVGWRRRNGGKDVRALWLATARTTTPGGTS